MVQLTIDFTTGLVNGTFDAEPRSMLNENKLFLGTLFSLDDSSVKLYIRYNCSVSDYCDVEFVRETLSSTLAVMQVEPIRQKLVDRLYNPNNAELIQYVEWSLFYEPSRKKYAVTQLGVYYCNTPACGYNRTALEIFQMLDREYNLPINLSVINATTPPWPTQTSTLKLIIISTSELTIVTATTSNHGSCLLEHFSNIIIIPFIIITYFYIH
ncbi:unnamed protein product [Rotaria sordida]|uniref:Uncharacterized protein n=1 Tax=Rotaria sordida TaxID=392033 RepID=A0A814L740_9BILA|nr:unnamed protein product [Rotaria sordida]CAF1061885.1 unnamed protein product [Rotaria sordida]CAF3673370.1 unnamed protein product [Rotaria sordida]CAF3757664.1 unnamed protein product [Rotaria sordida]